ncbi:BREX-2 system phosphatase PglZ [Dactylosporangium fulvum]|uniref:BREX-2 system phosphatase PglZ n=1 Tax=Dactylosporangium fulvum TaxID=53359 RepID=A0ABY5VYI4_9ACTN|nr:BREX-2 system phosphatase PglZ [Dactylosporangium fulvum]UWP82205.1 BREX-2 system phosphatase PglZ [Dactylosporangium fulvum]
MTPVQPAAIRRKVEAWLAEPDGVPAIALRATPLWTADPVLSIDGTAVRVVACPTPLAARAALRDRVEGERLVLLTELTPDELGDGVLAHLSLQTVRSVDPWDLVRQMFGGVNLDARLVRDGRWAAEALTDHRPAHGWPAPAGTVLTREHALRSLAGELLGLNPKQIDSAGLLQWSTDALAVQEFAHLPATTADGLTNFLVEIAGLSARPIMAAVRAGHGVDAIPLGLLTGALWAPAFNAEVPVQIAVARTRLEPRFGGDRLSDASAAAFRAAAEAWLDRAVDAGHLDADARPVLRRAEAIAAEIDATSLLAESAVLPTGFTQRMRTFADALRLAVPAGGQADPAAVVKAQQLLARSEEHRAADPAALETARMAVRLLRWLTEPDPSAPSTLAEALHRHVREDGWVDRARLDIFAGDVDPQLAQAYQQLHQAVQARRSRHDDQFAGQLAHATTAESDPGTMLRVEEVLDRVVQPILDHGQRVLLLVMDGMSVAAATELAESITKSGSWLELTPAGSARTGVLAALPTVTEVSRCSLLSGRIAVGQQAEERKAFEARYPSGVLLHKGNLRAGAGAAFAPDVVAALQSPERALVAAVVNTIDDALDRSDPGTIIWGQETIRAVRDLLALAQDRVVVVLSDHGHVVDRGPEAMLRPSPSSENRWRPATTPASDGERLFKGSRVAKAGGSVVLPWREELRYGPRKAGYHGGASPAEAVIPLLVFSAGNDQAVPGWSGAPVASPEWWRESLQQPGAAVQTPRPAKRNGSRRAASTAPQFEGALFEVVELPAQPPAAPPAPAPQSPALVDALLASEVYAQRRGTRAPLPDERVRAMLTALLANNDRVARDTLAALAGIPDHRTGPTITALQKLLQVEGYPVLEIDADGRTVVLNRALLIEQFHLEPS